MHGAKTITIVKFRVSQQYVISDPTGNIGTVTHKSRQWFCNMFLHSIVCVCVCMSEENKAWLILEFEATCTSYTVQRHVCSQTYSASPHRFAVTRRPDLSKLPEESLRYILHRIIRTRVTRLPSFVAQNVVTFYASGARI